MGATKLLAIILLGLIFLTGGTTMANEANSLSAKQEAIIPIAAFTATGNTEKLKSALEAGLGVGLTVNEIKEILVQMYAYTGFPRSLTALGVFMNLLEERKKAGKEDFEGPAAAALPAGTDRNELGTKIQTDLVGAPIKGPLFEFAPAIDDFLKEHLFCDIFARGVLTNQDRELATIGALAALPAPAQLAAHLNISLNTGISPRELEQYVTVLRAKVSPEAANIAQETLAKVLAARK